MMRAAKTIIKLPVLIFSAWVVLPALGQSRSGHDLVEIGGFAIDRHEVTIGQFRAFATATGRKTMAESDGGGFQFLGGWKRMAGWNWSAPYGRPGSDQEPAVHVTWREAADYCRWAGLRLPTDTEWVKSAYTELRSSPPAPFVRGTTYRYPSGDNPDGANQTGTSIAFAGFSADARHLGQGRGHLPVGITPAGVNGLHDMGGNVWEWVDHDVAGQKRTRGGSWWYGPAQMQTDALYEKAPDFPAVYIGFRCASDAPNRR